MNKNTFYFPEKWFQEVIVITPVQKMGEYILPPTVVRLVS